MAAMRLGCLFSQAGNVAYLHKAQSPYSVNTLAALAAQAAVQRHAATSRDYVDRSTGRARTAVRGPGEARHSVLPSAANFVLMRIGTAPIEVRDKLRERGVLVRDRSYEDPGCVRVTVGTREQTRRFLDGTGGDLVMSKPHHRVRHGRRARGCHRILPRDHSRRPCEHFTGQRSHPRADPGVQEPGRLEQRLGAVAAHRRRSSASTSPTRQWSISFRRIFFGDGNDGLILRERWIAEPGCSSGLSQRFQLAIFTGRLRG